MEHQNKALEPMTQKLKILTACPDFSIRADWPFARFSQIAKLRKETKRPDLELLSVFLGRGVIPYHSGGGQVHKPGLDLSAYQVVHPGDLVLNNQQAWRGSVGVSRQLGIISPAYVVTQLSKSLEPAFADYLFQSPFLVAQFVTSSKGVGDIQRDIHMPRLKNVIVPIPPLGDQTAIVKFLGYKRRRIEEAIHAKRKLIALLNEQKQSIIQAAVTRGLDPGVRFKPSGIAWLGDIPYNWNVVRNSALFSHRVEPGIRGLPILQVSLRSGVTADDHDQFGRPKRHIADPTKYKLVRKGDLAYNTMRMWQGAVGTVSSDGLVSPAYVVIEPRPGVHADFYELIFRTGAYKQQVNRYSTGIVSDRNRLYWESFKQMPNLLVPAEEQLVIHRVIGEQSRGMNAAISRLEEEIDLLREYRTRLVADVVTGKIDVTAAAAELGDEAQLEIDDSTEGGDRRSKRHSSRGAS